MDTAWPDKGGLIYSIPITMRRVDDYTLRVESVGQRVGNYGRTDFNFKGLGWDGDMAQATRGPS